MTGPVDSPLQAKMGSAARGVVASLRESLVDLRPRTVEARVGRVTAVADGVVRIVGLQRPFVGELLDVGGVPGIAEELAAHETRAVLLGPDTTVRAGATVRRRGHPVEVGVGPQLLGRVVDPLGRPLDGGASEPFRRRARAHQSPARLIDREPVTRPLRTGIFALDTMIPIGRGQRQIIVGDRGTGKADLAIEILAAMDPELIGIYVAIGGRGTEIAARIVRLREAGFFDRGFCVVTDADDPPGLVHLTPYAACTMAESLSATGHDVVVVFDDLTTHADVHRTLALLLERPVGREAHPVDVFYAHARLLERATQLCDAQGGGSITALPLVETEGGDLSAYIPTNMVSITDGQVRLDATLMAAGQSPAVDVALSVSRVGGKAQPALVRALAGHFKNEFSQFLELETFARFGTRLEPSAQRVVDWGRRVRRLLQQGRNVTRSWSDTVARMLIAGAPGLLRLPEDDEDTLERCSAEIIADPAFHNDAIDAGTCPITALPALREIAGRVVARAVQQESP